MSLVILMRWLWTPHSRKGAGCQENQPRVWLCAQLLNRVWLFVTPWTITRQAALSMAFFRQEYCVRSPFSTPWDLPNTGIKAAFPESPALAGKFFNTLPPGNPWWSEGWTFSPILLTSSGKREAGDWINSSDWWFNQSCLCHEACIKTQKDGV